MSAHSHSHHGSARLYLGVLLALLTLTVITVLAAGVNFGSPTVNVVVALFIATIKASLVALYFMHLRYDKPVNAVIFTSSLLFLGIFLGFCLIDVDSRDDVAPANLRPPAAAAATPAPAQPAAGH